MTTTIDEITPITHASDAAHVATAAYDALIALVETLTPDEWTAQTECPAWTVSDMVGHVIGASESMASKRELLRQNLYGFRHAREFYGNAMDAYNALQVAQHADLTPAERVTALRKVAPRAVRGRMRTPALLRAVSMTVKTNGSYVPGMPTKGNLGHLVDVIATRDVFMHRIDIARAVGREIQPTDCDRRIVEDAVGEWAGRHQQPVEVVLTGPAGGRFTQGSEGQRLEFDAYEFCRVLSGRAPGDGLLAVKIFF